MRKLIFTLAATVATLALTADTASAQHRRNVVANSGNGINNRVVVGNQFGGGFQPRPFFPQPQFNGNRVINSGNGIGNSVIVGNRGPSFGGGFNPFPGGVNVNTVVGSGNGIGNNVIVGNGGRPGGLNINTVVNSGNGVGNRIVVGNRR